MNAHLCAVCQTPNDPQAGFCHVCATPFAGGAHHSFAPLPSGTLVRDGTLRLDGVLGQGGFGITYHALEIGTGREVAVKEFFPLGCVRRDEHVVPSALLTAEQWQSANHDFTREARLLMTHTHPHIVQVLEVWHERGTAYFAMEWLRGDTLAQRIQNGGALRENQVQSVLQQIGGALQTLHEHKILHRDIKPENIVLCEESGGGDGTKMRAVLLDFGSARTFATGKTQQMTQIVSPGYAPLEQYGSQARFGTYTDLYSLGATLYHALTGTMPLTATERASGESLPPPESLNPNVSHRLSDAIMWALQIRVDERPQTVAQWLHAIEHGVEAAQKLTTALPPIQNRAPSHLQVLADDTQAVPIESTLEKPSNHAPPAEVSPSLEPRRLMGASAFRAPSMQHIPHSFGMTGYGNSREWYRVTIETRRVQWPKRCACCDAPIVTTLDMRTPTAWWQIPYCVPCREHAERGHGIEGTSNAIAIGCGVLGTLLALGFEAIRPGVLLGVGGVVGARIGAELLCAGLFKREANAPHTCCDYRPAARYINRNGDTFTWEFRNRAFAEEFCRLNAPQSVAVNTYDPFGSPNNAVQTQTSRTPTAL